ncbi:MAG: M3 family metallopeptidase [Bacteroides sp.]|nr:M3 family metallopeptidase [Bacteroides sp.]MCM1379937.1 M3 family metallopeptidase [Bacteroides sp.]MCM1446208.1 M3 family metallopeptidase [Prevotella sp.]
MIANNPLLSSFELPPFDLVKNEHFLPAIESGISSALAEIDLITNNAEQPTFANTIEALERTGNELDRTLGVFYPLLSANADDELMEISLKASQLLSDYSTKISLNEQLFERIRKVYDQRNSLTLSDPQSKLLEDTYLSFTRSGAALQGTDRERYREISARLSELTTAFGQNVKKELARYSLELTVEQTEGLPQWLIEQMVENARERKSSAPYVLTLQAPEYMAFMRLSPFDDLRKQLYLMYSRRNTSGEYSNIEVVKEIVSLRLEEAKLLGYDTFADFKLARTMAKKPEAALGLLDQLCEAYLPALKQELTDLRDFAGEDITPWNYAYHSNLLRKATYNFDPEVMRPYFELNAVILGVFGLAERLYGIKFSSRTDVPVYHPDVKVFEVNDSNGSPLGLLYTDFFPRAGRKSPGAWMTDFREADGNTRPQVNIVMNFTKPTAERPSLLSPGEVTTFLHEFGHSLHSLLTRTTYKSQAGTNVDRDFVELPSQFNENFFYSREFLSGFARHYQTGEPLPEELYQQMIASRRFGAAYACIRQLNFGYLDFGFHTVTEPISDVESVELAATTKTEIFPHIDGALIATSFGHIFSGGYAAGYYSYKWAEVLDADAFAYFEENGLYNTELAASFRNNILERGGSAPADELYRAFRGRDASIDALMRRDGITS